jgi:7,8-dihydropterin-6-yl-methyl-4-(beta-D-ribofuranosyl)aminobenzene 5'-phosphate synthase
MNQFLYLIIVIAGLVGCTPEKKEIPTEEGGSPTDEFTITNLYDAFGKQREGLTHDFGFSALIIYKGKSILFDAGTNADILRNNVEALGIDLSTIDYAIASHAHGDHINGFDYLLEVNPDVKIYLPFDFYAGAKINFNITGKEAAVLDSLPKEMQYFGGERDLSLTINQSGRFWNANTEFVAENKQIEEGIRLVATRSPYLGYGSKYPSVEEIRSQGGEHINTNSEIAFAGLPELSLSLSTDQGEVILVGCSHSSVQNIVKDTKAYTGNSIHLVYGGYHMLPYGREEIMAVTQHLKNALGVAKVAPAHCTGHLAFKLLMDLYGKDYVYAGLGTTIQISDPE